MSRCVVWPCESGSTHAAATLALERLHEDGSPVFDLHGNAWAIDWPSDPLLDHLVQLRHVQRIAWPLYLRGQPLVTVQLHAPEQIVARWRFGQPRTSQALSGWPIIDGKQCLRQR